MTHFMYLWVTLLHTWVNWLWLLFTWWPAHHHGNGYPCFPLNPWNWKYVHGTCVYVPHSGLVP